MLVSFNGSNGNNQTYVKPVFLRTPAKREETKMRSNATCAAFVIVPLLLVSCNQINVAHA